MKTPQFILPLFALFLGAIHGQAADPARSDISFQGTVVALSKAQALQFTSGHHLDAEAEAGFKDLQSLVEQKKAQVAANPAVTVQNGQRGTSGSGATKLEAEAVQSPSGDQIDVSLQLSYGGGIKINTAFMVKNGGVKFLGAFDAAEANKDLTYLVFIRSSAPKDH